VLVAGVALAISACSSAVPSDTESASRPGLADVLAEAELAGASEAQIRALEIAIGAGELPLEVVREAVGNTATCVESSGLWIEFDEHVAPSGLRELSYTVLGGDPENPDEGQRISDRCRTTHSQFIEAAYVLQPSSLALNDAFVKTVTPYITDCLIEAGKTVDKDATFDELRQLSREVLTGMSAEQLAQQDASGVVEIRGPAGPDCMIFYVEGPPQ
jgi:hypothetical protein